MTDSLFTTLFATFEKIVTPMGYGIVRVQINGTKRKVLQVMIERKDELPVTVDDCVEVSRTLSVHLDVEDPIRGQYNLEISSPGLDRPLVRPEDYKRFQGREIMVRTILPIGNRKNFQGLLESASSDGVSIRLKHSSDSESDRIEIRYGDIGRANLVGSV